MKSLKSLLVLGCALVGATLLTSLPAKATGPCITNLSVTVNTGNFAISYSTNSPGGDGQNGTSIWGVGLLSDCSSDTNCVGPEIMLRPTGDCSGYTGTVAATISWSCSGFCDPPGGSIHSTGISIPADCDWMTFHLCSFSNCSVVATCIYYSTCPHKRPPDRCQIENRFRIEQYPAFLLAGN
jgi:hypothetical protein